MNIYDISRETGVSIAMVSRVVLNRDKVIAATRQKVLNVIEKSGYAPNTFARSLGLNSIQLGFSVRIPQMSIRRRRFIFWKGSLVIILILSCSAVPLYAHLYGLFYRQNERRS